MEFGAHLPLSAFDESPKTLARLRGYASAAASLGYTTLCANDHLLVGRPWLDGPTALASVIEESEEVTLATTVCLPVIRGPVQTAKTLAAIVESPACGASRASVTAGWRRRTTPPRTCSG